MKDDTKVIGSLVLAALTMSLNAYIEGEEKGLFIIDGFKIFICLMEGVLGIFLVVTFTVVLLFGSVLSKELNSIESDKTIGIILVTICSSLIIYNLLNIYAFLQF